MNQSTSQSKTPQGKKNQPGQPQLTSNLPSFQISPQSIERYLPSQATESKDDPLKASESKLPVIYRKHQYSNKEFTQIHDLRTGAVTTRSKAPIKYTMSDFNEVAQIGQFMVNVSTLNADTTYKKSQWKELYNVDKFCKCTKSECLKNYCSCHQKGAFCTSECKCFGCKNRASRQRTLEKGEQQQRQRSRQKIKPKQSIRENTKKLQQNDQGFTNVCVCSKNKNCTKSYCGCQRLGINCSPQCLCHNCKN